MAETRPDANLRRAAELLTQAERVVFFTGAGVSRESGIPTFREAQTGLWANYDPEELATPSAFQRNPTLVWQWYDERRKKLDNVKPNPGHFAIAGLEGKIPGVTVVTQNVDGLHKRAKSTDVIELHGSITEFFCFDKRHPAHDVAQGLAEPPRCHCGSLIRPAVVWFNEALPEAEFARAQREITRCSLLFVAGTSSIVYPAAGLPLLALQRSIPIIEINPDDTPLSRSVTLTLRGASGQVLPELVKAFDEIKSRS